MEILNIGIPELIFIFLIMLIFLGPEGFSQTARGLARLIRKLIHSPIWNDVVKTQREIQELPTRLVREAGIEDIQHEVTRLSQQTRSEIHSIRPAVPMTPPPASTPAVVTAGEEGPDGREDSGDAYDYRAAALGQEAEQAAPVIDDPLESEVDQAVEGGQDLPDHPGQETG